MNKTKNICRLAFILTALFATTLTLASCAQKDDGDYFSSSEVIKKIGFGNGEANVNEYRIDYLFSNELILTTNETISGCAFIADAYDYDLWKYLIQYEVDYFDESNEYSDYRVRRVYVKNKTDALKVYAEVCNGFKKNLSEDFHYGEQFYGIDYDLEALMSDCPASLKVQNMNGATFSKGERIYTRERSYTDNNGKKVTYTQAIYEKRFVTPYIDIGNGKYKKGYFWVQDNGNNKDWPYVVDYFTDFYTYDSTGNYNYQSSSYAGVACKTKADAKKVLKDMLDAYKVNPTRFTNMPEDYYGWQAYGGANDAPDFNLDTLLAY